MTYTAKDTSVSSGQPIYLYEFARGATTYRYTSQAQPFAFTAAPSTIYAASGLSHSAIRTSGTIERDELTIAFPISDTFAQSLRVPAVGSVSVVIKALHTTDADEEVRVVYQGRVKTARTQTSVGGGQGITVVCVNLTEKLGRGSVSVLLERTCRHVLYSTSCGAVLADHQTAGTVTAITGTAVTVAAAGDEANGFYGGGLLEFGGERVGIAAHTGTGLTLAQQFPALETAFGADGDQAVLIAPGCPLSRLVCDSRFDNVLNFGGNDYLPAREMLGRNIGT